MSPDLDPKAIGNAKKPNPSHENAPHLEPEITKMDKNAFIELLDKVTYHCTMAEHDQLEESGYWGTWNIGLGLTAAVAGALGGITAVTNSGVVIAGMLAVLAGITGAANTFLKPSDHADKAKTSADEWSGLLDDLNLLRLRTTSDESLEDLYKDLRKLMDEKKKVTDDAPFVSTRIYRKVSNDRTIKNPRAQDAPTCIAKPK
jgi:hypothetical protein